MDYITAPNALNTLPPRSRTRRVLAFLVRVLRFCTYCALSFIRPLVMLATGALAFLFGVGAVVMFVMYNKGTWTCLGVAGAGIACIALRELYDGLVILVAPRDRGVFLN